jgi:hypothetical protein
MIGPTSRPARFTRCGKPADRTRKWKIRLTDDEKAIVEAYAAALGMSFEDYVAMRLLTGRKEVKGNA